MRRVALSLDPDAPLSTTGWASPWTARLYDRQLALERSALRTAVDLAAPARDELVLDLATGTGALLRVLAQRAERPRRAIGIDASDAMLSRAGPLPDGWRLINGDARRLPLDDASVDVVTCAYLLHLLDPGARRAVLGEIMRVLTPRGRVVGVTLGMPGGLVGRSLLAPMQRELCRGLGAGSGWCALDPEPELAAAGLAVRRRRVCTRGYTSVCLLAEPG
jgi:ubiquinone/menaquinone biosynthesis C-methylase UbiE